MALLLDAELHIASASGTRTVAARDFFLGALTVDLASDDVVTEVVCPKLAAKTGWGFEEVARRSGDFALGAVAATLALSDGVIAEARIALTGVGPTCSRAVEAEALLRGQVLEPDLIGAVIDAVRGAIDPIAICMPRRIIGVIWPEFWRAGRSPLPGGAPTRPLHEQNPRHIDDR